MLDFVQGVNLGKMAYYTSITAEALSSSRIWCPYFGTLGVALAIFVSNPINIVASYQHRVF